MIIRPVEPKDLPQLLALCREHADYEGLQFTDNAQITQWQSAFFSKHAVLFGWVCAPDAEDAALAGYMTATIDYSTWMARRFVYLDCLFLRPAYRGRGIGRRLMSELNVFASRKACAAIEWQTPPTNITGLGFYRAIGARELDKVRLNLSVMHPEVAQ